MDEWEGNERERIEEKLMEEESPQFFYNESKVMVESNNVLYGNISKVMKEEFTRYKIRQYLMAKNKKWTRNIFNSIDWDTMGACMERLPPVRVIYLN